MEMEFGGYRVVIEPNADGESPHLYVTISDEDGIVYEGRLYPNKKGDVR